MSQYDDLKRVAEACEISGDDVQLAPDVVLGLLEQIEALRKQVDRLLAHCPDGECTTCGEIICPHGGAMHFHHDGCPSCAEHESAMSVEPRS